MAGMSARNALASGHERELLGALELHLPGLSLLDHELEIQRGAGKLRAAALVARASGGQLVLIEELEGPPEKAALRALELAALAREHGPELLGRFDCAAGPLLVLLAGEHARELGALLAPLLGRELQLFSTAQLRTRAGTRIAVAPLCPGRASPGPPSRAEFLAGLEAPTRALAEELWARLSAPALGARAEIGSAGVRWSDARGPLCSLARGERGLAGRLAGLDAPIELGNEAEGRGFLDAVLALHLERLGNEMEGPSEGAREAAFDPRQPVLSEAEIAAFHDPAGPSGAAPRS
jgi:hypothetical protein